MAELRIKLEVLEKEWAKQCTANMPSSNMYINKEQEGYKQIVAMGPQIAPLVAERMRHIGTSGEHFAVEYAPKTLPWAWVLEEVTGFHLEDDADYRAKVREYYWKTEIEEPLPLPWAEYVDDSGVRTKEDIIDREKQRQHHLKAGREEFAKSHSDPDGKGYVREIAVPHLLEWWDKIGVKKFGSNATEGKNG